MIECHIRYVRYPNRASAGTVCPCDDDTFDIYVNTLFSESDQKEWLEHEIRHLEDDHFYTDKPIGQIEAEARGEIPCLPSETEWLYDPWGFPLEPMPPHSSGTKTIICYKNLNAIVGPWKKAGVLEKMLSFARSHNTGKPGNE